MSNEEKIDRRMFVSRSAVLVAGGAVLTRTALSSGATLDRSSTAATTTSTPAPPPRKPSTNDVFPGVRRERAWIPMKDGVYLSAELWIPESAGPENRAPPVPAAIPCCDT